MATVRERAEIPEEYTWDLESIYASDEAWEGGFEGAEATIGELEALEGTTTESPESLRAVLDTYEDLMRQVGMVASYARMRRDEDTSNDTYQAYTSRSQSLASQASAAASFIEPEIQAASWSTIESMIEADADIEIYEHYLEDIHRLKAHTRSAEVESLLADLGEVLGTGSDVYTLLSNADMSFPTLTDPDGEEVEITQANFVELLKHEDRDFREAVYTGYYETWSEVRNAVTAAYRNSVKGDVKVARARNYETARQAAMNGPNIPTDVYDTLIETVRDNLDVLHHHAELKQRALDVDELQMWDIYMPIAQSESPDIPYDEAAEYVVEAVEPLGEDYQSQVEAGLADRWIDVYETPNKRSGAYSGGTYDTQPFILMNYQGTVSSMFTLAHELGHSLHSELTCANQPYVYSGYEIFVAEVASTVNEALLTEYLLDTIEDERFRRHLLNEYLERFRSTLYRQAMFAEFEHRAHEQVENGEALTPDSLDSMYLDLKSAFYEPAIADEHIAREWMRIPHFYRAYYVYQYCTGVAAAVAISRQILDDGESAVSRYLDFLKRGSHGYPLELLQDAGVDMSTAAPIESAVEVYGAYLDEMEQLL